MNSEISEIIKDLSESFPSITTAICLMATTIKKKKSSKKSKKRK